MGHCWRLLRGLSRPWAFPLFVACLGGCSSEGARGVTCKNEKQSTPHEAEQAFPGGEPRWTGRAVHYRQGGCVSWCGAVILNRESKVVVGGPLNRTQSQWGRVGCQGWAERGGEISVVPGVNGPGWNAAQVTMGYGCGLAVAGGELGHWRSLSGWLVLLMQPITQDSCLEGKIQGTCERTTPSARCGTMPELLQWIPREKAVPAGCSCMWYCDATHLNTSLFFCRV